MEKCALIKERLLAPPISPAHFSQLDLPIMASGEDVILVYESIVRGHHVYKDIWTPMIGELLEVQREPENEHDHRAVCSMRTFWTSDTSCFHDSG